MELRSSRLRMPERMPAIKKDPELLQVGIAVQSAQHLLRGDEDGSRVSGAGRRRAGIGFP